MMPAKENVLYKQEDKEGAQVILPSNQKDVDKLVLNMKENLKLSNQSLKSKSAHRKHYRPSPYEIPGRTGTENCDYPPGGPTVRWKKRHPSKNKTLDSEDPLDVLSELLREGSLIKEAVRRLHLGLTRKFNNFYDSDEEACRTPVHTSIPLCQV